MSIEESRGSRTIFVIVIKKNPGYTTGLEETHIGHWI